MTTLPQTTGARFPRAGARTPSIPALAQHGAGGPSAPGGSGNAMTVADVLRVLRANLLLIILCLLVALAIGYVVNNYVFEKYYKEWTARAVLQVQVPSVVDITGNAGNASAMDRQMLEIRQKTLAQKLLSPDLWRPLLTNPVSPARNTPWMKSFNDSTGNLNTARAVDAVQQNLGVTPNPSTELITVTLGAPTQEDAKTLLEAIVTKLIETEQGETIASTTDDRRTYTQLVARFTTQIDNLNTQINELSARLNTAPDSAGGGNGVLLIRTMELQGLVQERIRKEAVFTEAMGDYSAVQQALDAGQTPGEVEQMLEFNPSLQRMSADLDQSEVFVATRLAQYSPDHRMVKEAIAQRDAIKAQVEEKRNTLRVSMGAMIKDSKAAKAGAAKADLDQTNAQILDLERRVGELNRENLNLSTAIDTRDLLVERRSRIEERTTALEATAAQQKEKKGTVRLWSPIEKPDTVSFPNLRLTMGVAGLMGLGLSLGIAFLRELMDQTVRSPRDITKVGQLNLLGMIPHTDDDPQAAAGELSLAISQSPNSIIAENFRQVRTRLQHAASLDTTRSLLVTSPGPGDGKTTVACNIAAGLALNGRKILLVDANFRRPELHRVFGITNDSGFGSVLSGAVQIEQAAHKTQVPNLDVLTTGPRPANPTELLESQLLTDFIDHALEEYDHVIFDTGPILLVSETVALAPRVDGVVTVVRAKANSRGLLQRMRDALKQLKAEHLGVVLNGVRQHTGGYYRRNIKNYYAYQNGND